MISWAQAIQSKDTNTFVFLEGLMEGLDISPRTRDGIKGLFRLRVTRFDDGKSPVAALMVGLDRAKKKDLAQEIARRLSVEFIEVNCGEYERRLKASEGQEPKTVPGTPRQVGSPPFARQEATLALQVPSRGMHGWLLGPYPGYVLEDVSESLASKLHRNPLRLVYFEDVNQSTDNFLISIKQMLETGAINNSDVMPGMLPVYDTIFVFSADVAFEHDRSNFQSKRNFNKLWEREVTKESRFTSFCEIITVD